MWGGGGGGSAATIKPQASLGSAQQAMSYTTCAAEFIAKATHEDLLRHRLDICKPLVASF